MSRLKVFCTSQELTDWLRLFCAERDLGALLFETERAGEPSGACARRPEEVRLDGITLPCFFFPLPGPSAAPSYQDARLLERTCVVLWPGGERQSEAGPVLTSSEFFAPPEADAHLQWRRRRMKKVLQAGVVGRNDHFGGAAIQPGSFHSTEARRLLRSGFTWRQLRDGFASYEPLATG